MDAESPTQTVIEQVKRLREGQGLSGAGIARRMTELGIPWDRNTIAKLENGHRASLGLDEWLALAYILDVPPLALLLPSEPRHYRITPATFEQAVTVGMWLLGYRPLPTRSAGLVHPGVTAAREARFRAEMPAYLLIPEPESDGQLSEPAAEQIRQIVLDALRSVGKSEKESGEETGEHGESDDQNG